MTLPLEKFEAYLIEKGIENKSRRVALIRAVKRLAPKLPVKSTPEQAATLIKSEFAFNQVTAAQQAWDLYVEFSLKTHDASWVGRNLNKAAIYIGADTEQELFALTQLRKLGVVTFDEVLNLRASNIVFGEILATGRVRFVEISLTSPNRVIRFTHLDAIHLYEVAMRAVSAAADARASLNEAVDEYVFSDSTLKQVDPSVFRSGDVLDVIAPPIPPHLISLPLAEASTQLQQFLQGRK